MKRRFFLLIFIASIVFVSFQHAEALSITATPETPVFGPNDWIYINVKVHGYNGGQVAWLAHRPDGSTLSGNLTNLKSDGSIAQQIVRSAYDNYFGNWTINYRYNSVNQTTEFQVAPIILTVSTDKDLYYEPDVMNANITTSYYVPIASRAPYFHVSFVDGQGNPVQDIPMADIRAFQHSIIYNFHMIGLADYHPPGLYKLKVQYFNKVLEIPFLLGKYTELMTVTSSTDKNTYQIGDTVNMHLLVTRVTQSEGTVKITDPIGNVTTRQFQVSSFSTPLVLTDMTKRIGTYSYIVQYAGASGSGSYNVGPTTKSVPNIRLDLALDKLNYRPGEIIHAKVQISQAVANSISLWVVNPDGVAYPKVALPVSSTDAILPHQVGFNYATGQWDLYIDYDGVIKSSQFDVRGQPVDQSELVNKLQFAVPSFVSYLGTPTTFNSPTGVATDSNNNDVYVVDSGDSLVRKFDSTGKLLLSWGGLGAGNSQFIHPSGIFVGKKYVFVADTGNAKIKMFDKNGSFIYAWGGYGEERGMFHTPVALAADNMDNLFVADSDRPTLQVFNDQFQFTDEIRPLLTAGANFTALEGIAFDSKNNLYASSAENTVIKFSGVGDFLNFFGSAGTEPGRFETPTAIAIDKYDNFYVADTNNHRVQKFDQYGNFLTSWGSEGPSAGQFEEPVGLATDSLGDIYVADKKNNSVQKFSLHGTGNQVIPYWVKERVHGWSEGALPDDNFVLAVRFLIDQRMINATLENGISPAHIPNWVKNEAGWWSNGQISNKAFAGSMEYLISNKIFKA